MGRQGLREQIDVGAIGAIGHADDLGAMRPQQRMKIEVAGIVDQHRIAGLDQKTTQKIDRLRAGIGEHDLIGRDDDAVLTHAAREKLTQRRQAKRHAIVGQRGLRCA